MLLDMHVHLLSARTAPIARDTILDCFETAADSGLQALCICEHRESSAYEELLTLIFEQCAIPGLRYVESGVVVWQERLVVLSGAELELADGSNVGVHAPPTLLRSLSPLPEAYSLRELRERLGDAPTIVAHHVFWAGKQPAHLPDVLTCTNAIELPAKDWLRADRYRELAAGSALPLVAGSDAHTFVQVGAAYTELELHPSAVNHRTLAHAVRHTKPKAHLSGEVGRLVRMSKQLRTNYIRTFSGA